MLASLIGVLAGWYLKKYIKKKQYHEEYLALEQERDDLNKRMSQAEEAMDRRYYLMTSENQKTHDELDKSNSDNRVLSKKIQSLSAELDETRNESNSLQDELTAAHNEVVELQAMNDQLLTEQNSSKSQSSELKESKKLIDAPSSDKSYNSENDAEIQSLQSEITSLNTENTTLKTRVAEYTQKKLDVTNIASQLNRANSERERLLSNQALGNKKNDLIDELKNELSSSQARLADKETELARYKSYLIDEEKKLVAEIETNTAKLSSSEQLSTELQNKYSESIELIETLEAKVSRLSDENRELQTQLACNETEHTALRQDHNKQKYQIEQLSSQVRKLSANPEDK